MKAVIALGANIGNPKENLDIALALLKEATDFQSVSSYHSTAPVGWPGQPDYLNAVCILKVNYQQQIYFHSCTALKNLWGESELNAGDQELLI